MSAGVVMALMAGVPQVQSTQARFIDNGTMTTGVFTMSSVPATTASCGLLAVGTLQVVWTAQPNVSGYTVVRTINGSAVADTNVSASTTSLTVVPGLLGSGTIRVIARYNTWTAAASNQINYTVLLAAASLCS